MQTFLPYPSFTQSASVLDNRRLGKQRVEAFQIIRVLTGASDGWSRHPAVRMWAGYELALRTYFNIVSREWTQRGFRHTMGFFPLGEELVKPPWLTPEFCLAHQSNLIRKLPSHYRPIFGPDVPDDLPYIWPVRG